MVQGKKKGENIDRELIFSKIEPYDVYMMYMPWPFALNMTCKNPFVEEDNPSFIIGDKFGEVTHKAFNSPHRGDCITFVMEFLGLSYSEALNRIGGDFSIGEGGERYRRIISLYERPKGTKPPSLIQVRAKPFGEEHKEYLSEFHISPRELNFCSDTKCVAVGEWALNRAKMPLRINEVAFAYNLKNERGNWLKVYRPFAGKKDKWMSNIPFVEMHGVGNINGCKIGIITKSIKEGAWINKYITSCVEVVQAEDYSAITEENKRRLLNGCEELYISFDSDPKGVESCLELTREMGCRYINPPKELLKHGVTDWTDMSRYYKSPQPVIEFFKSKGINNSLT